MTSLPLDDIQGLVLRGYGMDALRVYVLEILDSTKTRAFLAQVPITASTPWDIKPDACINVGFTASGLQVLSLAPETLESFPEEFRAGAVARAAIVGDTEESAPEHWIGGLNGDNVHLLITIYAQNSAALAAAATQIEASWNNALRIISIHDAAMLPGNVAHFGYRDGFSQPTIDGGLPNLFPERAPLTPAGEFLLGYESQFSQFSYPVPQPRTFGLNGSFMAFRILSQDCVSFDALLQSAPSRYGISGEMLAAKMVGRWRNGVPLALSPTSDAPSPEIPIEQFNAFDYTDDPKGLRCPIGAHMRRNNPRNSSIAGGSGFQHRILRRGLPYGPPFDPQHPDDGIDRGLLGIFLAVSLKDQFEFLMQQWVNGDLFAAGIRGTKDPILGNHDQNSSRFTFPMGEGKTMTVTGFPPPR